MAPSKWRCPLCLRIRRWGAEHALDFYPMLLNMGSLPTCCLQEFPLWAYRSASTEAFAIRRSNFCQAQSSEHTIDLFPPATMGCFTQQPSGHMRTT